MKLTLLATLLFLLGCGDGEITNSTALNSSSEQTNQHNNTNNQSENNQSANDDSATKIYRIKSLPTIKESAIPKQIIAEDRTTKVEARQYREVGERSEGFSKLHEVSKFFYQQQLMMNIDLGYIDSMWGEISSYCKDKNSCSIPAKKITFTYTKALYNRDSELIKEYEFKTKDMQTFQELKKSLKSSIGKEIKLGALELISNANSKYHYSLKTQGFTKSETSINSLIKWSDDNSSFYIQESIFDTRTNKKEPKADMVVSYSFDTNNDTKINKFTLYKNSQSPLNKEIEFREKEDGSIYFISDEVYKESNLFSIQRARCFNRAAILPTLLKVTICMKHLMKMV